MSIDPKERTIIIPYSENGNCDDSTEIYQWLLTKKEESLLRHVEEMCAMRPIRYPKYDPKIKSFIAVHVDNGIIKVQGYLHGTLTGEYEIEESLLNILLAKGCKEKITEIANKTKLVR